MSIQLTTTIKVVATATIAVALIFGAAFAVTTVKAEAVTLAELVELFISLGIIGPDKADAARAALATSGGGSTSGSGCTTFTFTRNHSSGDSGGEVMEVQKFLNADPATQVAASGVGSAGSETSYYGSLSVAAATKFQEKYASEILTPLGLTSGTGYWGASSRAKANALNATCGTGTGIGTGTGTGTTVPAGTSLVVSSTAQPANSLAPGLAARVPFTKFVLTNNSTGPVTVDSVTVERTGLAVDSNFSGVVLIDNTTGTQLGNSKTFNSLHQAKIGEAFTLQAGESRTYTIAGNIVAAASVSAGQVASMSVVGINTSAAVAGSLPIVGALHTMNATLTIGTVTMAVGTSDPDTTALNSTTAGKEIGTTDYVVAEVRATAGSAEDVWIKNVRWNQAGSASGSDIANVRAEVDGTSYPMVISSDGKFYTATFPGNGIEIQKGFQKDIAVRLDIVDGSARTIRFDIHKATDLFIVGETFGYGITPTQSEDGSVTDDGSAFTASTPFFSSTVIQINAGSISSVSRASEVPAQNVSENTPNEPVAGFVVDLKGEGIQIQNQIFYILTTGTGDPADLTNVTLVDANGAVVAGPVDGAVIAGKGGKVTFTDTVTYPTGRNVYTIKGKYGTDFANGDTVKASTTPSTDWTNVTGTNTGDTISLASLSSVITGATMTVKAGAVAVTIASSPAAQTVVAGVTNLPVGAYNFDATQSGEDVRFNSAKFYYDEVTALAGATVTNCFAYDGATRLSNTAVNPPIVAATSDDGDLTFTFDNQLVVPQGTVKIVEIRCDLPGSSTSGAWAWDLNFSTTAITTFSGTGLGSSQTITPTTPSAAITDGNTQTVATAGALTVYEDSSSPSYTLAAGGATGVTIGVMRLEGTNEDQRIDRIALVMSNVAATSTPQDLSSVSLWDGATQVGTALFTGTNRSATSTLTSTVIIPKDSFKLITVKADLSTIGTGQAGESGVLVQVNYDDSDRTGTRSVGQASGTTINRTSNTDTSFDGVRMFKSYPTVAQLTTPSLVLVGGTDVELSRFSVTANAAGGISLSEVTVNLATSSASAVSGTTTVTDMKVYAYTDSGFSSGVSGFIGGLAYDGGEGLVAGDNEAEFSSLVNIPAGTTYYFRVVADVTLTAGTGNFSGNVDTKITGDSAFPIAQSTLMINETAADAETTNDAFIWSPLSTTTNAARANIDWTNGYGIPGLPSTGLSGTRLSK